MSTSFQLQNNALKELPHNIEAEQGILGAILLNNEIFFDISETINVEHFYEPVHKLILDFFCYLYFECSAYIIINSYGDIVTSYRAYII